MFAYLPSNISHYNLDSKISQDLGQDPNVYWRLSMSGAIIAYNTHFFKHRIMKFAIACALTIECMDPLFGLTENMSPSKESGFQVGAYTKHCDVSYPERHPFVCHRFDQSLWMILVANAYNFDQTKYRPSLDEIIAQPNRKLGREGYVWVKKKRHLARFSPAPESGEVNK